MNTTELIALAKEAGFPFPYMKETNELMIDRLAKFAELLAKSNAEPVAVFTGKYKGNTNGKQWIECELTGCMPNTGDFLYLHPTLPAEQDAELLNALIDMNNGWKYIRATYGDLYGVGWDRAEQAADKAIANRKDGV